MTQRQGRLQVRLCPSYFMMSRHELVVACLLIDMQALADQIRCIYDCTRDHHLVSNLMGEGSLTDHWPSREAVGKAAAAELVLRFHMWLDIGWPKHANWCQYLLDFADFSQLIADDSLSSSACLQASSLIARWLSGRAIDIRQPHVFKTYATRRMEEIRKLEAIRC